MVKQVNIKPSRFFAQVDGHSTIDTALKSVTLYPDAYAIQTAISIEFPDLLKTNAYFRWGEGFYSGGRTECRSYVTALYQEWGPDEPNADDWYFPGNPDFRARHTSPAIIATCRCSSSARCPPRPTTSTCGSF